MSLPAMNRRQILALPRVLIVLLSSLLDSSQSVVIG
jgi:hypothetical protein